MTKRNVDNVLDKEELANILFEALCIMEALEYMQRGKRRLRGSEIPIVKAIAEDMDVAEETLHATAYNTIAEARDLIDECWSFGYPLLSVLRDLDKFFDFSKDPFEKDTPEYEATRDMQTTFRIANTLLDRLENVEA